MNDVDVEHIVGDMTALEVVLLGLGIIVGLISERAALWLVPARVHLAGEELMNR